MDFLVSVRCFTYNHAPYIEDTLNGFVIQETSFPFVCIIVDDASTDGEPQVIKRYFEEHFEVGERGISRNEETDEYEFFFARHLSNKNCFFAVYLLKQNYYGTKEKTIRKYSFFSEFHKYAKYHATCEGDDYWTNKDKLQTQTDFLENHADYGLVYGRVEIVNQNNIKLGECFGGNNETFKELLNISTIPTLTALYRRELITRYLEKINPIEKDWLMGDYPKWLFIAHESKIKFSPIVMGCYRKLDESASHSKSFERSDAFLRSLFEMKSFFCKYYDIDYDLHDYKYKSLAVNAIRCDRRDKSYEYLDSVKVKDYRIRILEYLSKNVFSFKIVSLFYRIKLIR